MNNYLKYNLKSDFKLMGMGLLVLAIFSLGFSGIFGDIGAITVGILIMCLGVTIVFWYIGCIIGIYSHFFDRAKWDVYGSIAINKSNYFNTLFLRTLIVAIIPVVVVQILIYSKGEYNPEIYTVMVESSEIDGSLTLYSDLVLKFFEFATVIFFVVICGKVSSVLVNLVFMNLFRYILFGLTFKGVIPNPYHVVEIITGSILIILAKYLFSKRQVENIGNPFVFRNLDLGFTLGYTVFGGVTIALSGFVSTQWDQILFLSTVVLVLYTFLGCFFFGINKKFIKNLKFVLIPLVVCDLVLAVTFFIY